jgi:hypothetical protein
MSRMEKGDRHRNHGKNGVMEYWSNGIVEYWNIGRMDEKIVTSYGLRFME